MEEPTKRPFQFHLRSIFVVMFAVATVLGFVRWASGYVTIEEATRFPNLGTMFMLFAGAVGAWVAAFHVRRTGERDWVVIAIWSAIGLVLGVVAWLILFGALFI